MTQKTRYCNPYITVPLQLTGMFLGTDPCPQKNGRGMLECAAQKGDHTQCCMERRVHTVSTVTADLMWNKRGYNIRTITMEICARSLGQ